MLLFCRVQGPIRPATFLRGFASNVKQKVSTILNVQVPASTFYTKEAATQVQTDNKRTGIKNRTVSDYEPCGNYIPAPPPGIMWPEEKYIHDPECTDVLDIANASMSKAWILGSGNVSLGDKLQVNIELYNGRGERKTRGGDLVSVLRMRV